MAKGPRCDRAKERFWQKMLADFRSSGLSIRGFCRAHGFPESAFYFWPNIPIPTARPPSVAPNSIKNMHGGGAVLSKRKHPPFICCEHCLVGNDGLPNWI